MKGSIAPSKRTILYIVPATLSFSDAASVNSSRRKNLLERLGYSVTLLEHDNGQFLKTFLSVLKRGNSLGAIIIRIDGGGVLDKYTLLKLFLPRVPVIWEVHGFPEERLAFSGSPPAKWFVRKNNVKRMVLSYLVHTVLFISRELEQYAKQKIHIRNSLCIPNFINTSTPHQKKYKNNNFINALKHDYFIVLWGGGAYLPWQATDTIQQVARKVYSVDKQVVFVLIGPVSWFPIAYSPNILFLNPMAYDDFARYVSAADVCLALYHKSKFFPFYLYPMKILDYLSMGKPVIATGLGAICSIITNGKNGFLTNNSVDDVARKILLLKHHPPLLRLLSRNATRSAQTRFTDARARQLYEALFGVIFSSR